MNRRQFLTGAVTHVPIASTGCLTDNASDDEWEGCTGEWSPGVEADEPTLAAGEEATVRIVVENVTGLSLQIPIHNDDLEINVGEASVSPPPDRSLDTYPPKWQWSECTNVEVVVPVRVAEDSPPGENGYTVQVSEAVQDGDGDSMEREFTIIVSID
jgi:hypothetical protein